MNVTGANWMGKTKFCMQVGVLQMGYLLLLLNAHGQDALSLRAALFWSALATTVASYVFLGNFVRWHAHELADLAAREAAEQAHD
jgi:hypothetical protein